MPEQNIYGTRSLFEAAYCVACGFKIVGKKQDRDKVIIYLEGHDVHIKALDFYNGGKVEAKVFVEAYRTLKDFAFKE